MKQLLAVCLCFFAFAKAYAQQPQVTDTIIATVPKTAVQDSPVDAIKTFFKHFNALEIDSLRTTMVADVKLQSLIVSKSRGTSIQATDGSAFLDALASIPAGNTLEERIIEYSSSLSDQCATVSAVYEFYSNGNYTHYGTNIFTLFRVNECWQIVAIADTRFYP